MDVFRTHLIHHYNYKASKTFLLFVSAHVCQVLEHFNAYKYDILNPQLEIELYEVRWIQSKPLNPIFTGVKV